MYPVGKTGKGRRTKELGTTVSVQKIRRSAETGFNLSYKKILDK
jgi:hypothetical protein